MDADRFDRLSRIVSTGRSRRGVLSLLVGACLVGSLVPAAVAKTKPCGPCTRRRNGRCKPKPNGRPCPNFGICQGGRCVRPICAGKNFCGGDRDLSCGLPQCDCFVTKGSGAPFCAAIVTKTPCSACTAEETCVDATGCGVAEGCATPCPEPF